MSDYSYCFPGWKSFKDSLILKKDKNIDKYIRFMFDRTQSMFKYDGLPETINKRMFELMLQANGNVFITEFKDNLYVFTGGFGGEPNVYYEPTIYTIANPYLKFNKMCKVDEDGILIRNDSMMQGLFPIHAKYAELLAECDITLRDAIINLRILNIISATDDKSRNSALEFLRQLETGKIGVIAESAFLEGIKVREMSGSNLSNYISQIVEFNQFIKASWFMDLGLKSQFNMKREALNVSETSMNDDILVPLVDNMLEMREIGVDNVNKMYGTNITVSYDSSWLANELTDEANLEIIQNEAENSEDAETEDKEVEQEDKEDEDNKERRGLRLR